MQFVFCSVYLSRLLFFLRILFLYIVFILVCLVCVCVCVCVFYVNIL